MSGWQPIGERPARVGLIGLGAMGRNHLRLLSAREDVELVAISDPLPEVLEAARETTEARGYIEPQEMLAKDALDAVVIASPTTTHLDLGLAAVGRGVAALIEKPLAATPSEADGLVTASADTGVPIQVGHVERFNPRSWSWADFWTRSWLSTVYAITSRRAGRSRRASGRWRDHRSCDPRRRHPLVRRGRAPDPRLGRDRPARPPGPRGPAVRTPVVPVGLGRDAARRLADAGQAPDADGGRRGGHVRARLPQPAAHVHALHRHDEPAIRGYAPTFEGRSVDLPLASGEPLAAEARAFLTVVREGGRPVVNVEDGRWAVVVADALLRAARERRTVELDEVLAR